MHIFLSLLFSYTLQIRGFASQNPNFGKYSRNISYAISDFKTMRTTRGHMYVDKTLFIKELMDCQDGTILITRPPGFSKTLALSTLYYFFSDQFLDSPQLFFGLNIRKTEPDLNRFSDAHMGQHPVIRLDFSNVRGSTYSESYSAIQEMISKEFLRHEYVVLGNPSLTDMFESVSRKTADEKKTADSINRLRDHISAYHNGTKRVIVLIDGYDTPIYTSFVNKYYSEMAGFMESFLHRTVTENLYTIKVVITGVVPLAGGILPKNVATYTIFDKSFSRYFGFVREELDVLANRRYGRAGKELMDYMQVICNGYTFGGSLMFNPKAVIQVLFECSVGRSLVASRPLLKDLLLGYGLYPVLTIQQLLLLQHVPKEVSRDLSFPDLQNHEQLYWSCLLHFGFLSVVSSLDNEFGDLNVTLRLSNIESHTEIRNILEKRSGLLSMKIPDYRKFLEDLKNRNYPAIRASLDTYLRNGGVYFKQPGKDIDMKRIQAYIVQMTMGLQRKMLKDDYAQIRVLIGKATTIKIYWYRFKNMVVCPFVRNTDKNRTQISIWCNGHSIVTCLNTDKNEPMSVTMPAL